MNVLQIGTCAGVPHTLANASGGDVAFINPHIFGYIADREVYIGTKGVNPNIENILAIRKIIDIENKYDILHFHGGTFLPRELDIILWKIKNKIIYLHFHGTDIRNRSDRYYYSLARYADKVIVSTPDLIKFIPDSEWIPNPVPLINYGFTNKKPNGRLKIFHAPSNMQIKGTQIIRKAIKNLQIKGYPIDLICLSGVNHSSVLGAMAESDIVIDWINSNYGIYGIVSCEAMAMNKPVICSIKQEYESFFPNCPILKVRNDDPKEIENHIIELLNDNNLIKKLV
ncbi:MAG: hypothetical protein AB9819_05250 [Methanomassiliicoccales archaeon]